MKKSIIIIFLLLHCAAQSQAGNWIRSAATQSDIFERETVTRIYDMDAEINSTVLLSKYHRENFRKKPGDYEFKAYGLPGDSYLDEDKLWIYWAGKQKEPGIYEVTITGQNEEITDTTVIVIKIKDDWESSMLPALGYTMYMPRNNCCTGDFRGISIQYALISWIHRNDNRGPSHGQLYLYLDLLSSDKDDVKSAFAYGMGIDMSFERNPKRKWFLPYFGLSLGWINQEIIDTRFVLTTNAGLWLYADRNIFVNAKVGYMVPTTQSHYYQGLKGTLSVNFSMW